MSTTSDSAALFHDFRSGLRALRRSPSSTAITVLTLALGIGATTAIFSVWSSVLLRPLPFAEPQELVKVWNERPGVDDAWDNFSEGEYLELERRNRTFASIAAFYPDRSANLADTSPPMRVTAARVSANFFATLGVEPHLGRAFLPTEDTPGGDDAVILSYGLWQTHFGGQDGGLELGQTIQVDTTPRRVVGIAPPGFDYPAQPDLWLPLALDRVDIGYLSSQYLLLVGRLHPEVSLPQAEDDLGAVTAWISAEDLTKYPGMRAYPVPLLDDVVRESKEPLRLLMAAVACLLLISCANVAGLLLTRFLSLERAFAIRMALGASRGRVVRLMLAEALLLSVLAAGLGLFLAHLGIRALMVFETGLPRLAEVRIDATVLAFACLGAVLTAVLTGLLPALQSSRLVLAESLKESSRGSGGPGRQKMRGAFVVAEVALSFVLLIGAGLLGRTLHHLMSVDPGFRTDGVFTFRVAQDQGRYQDPVKSVDFLRRSLDGIRALPGVEEAGAITILPLSGRRAQGFAWKEGLDYTPDILPPRLDMRWIMPGYFRGLEIPLLRGRLLDGSEAPTDTLTAVVSESMAETLWPGEDPIGRRFRLARRPTDSTPWRTVIGVVADVRATNLGAEPKRMAYFPRTQEIWARQDVSFVIRSPLDPDVLAPAVREVIRAVDPAQPIFAVRTLEDVAAASVRRERTSAALIALFAALALVLAVVGLYGVLSYGISRRTREIGIRMVLAARPRDVLRMVLFEGMALAVAGLVLGLLASLALVRLLASLLVGVEPLDPLSFAGAGLVLGMAAFAACYVPARRVMDVSPVSALRHD